MNRIYPAMRFFFSTILPLLLAGSLTSQAQQLPQKNNIIVAENFDHALDTTLWKVEMVPFPQSAIRTQEGKLVIDTKGGATVWLNKMLHTNIAIEYDWTVLVDSGVNDRLSDLNQFWMATDPKNENLFTKQGQFKSYDSLSLYYVGMGGNTNSTTRFRKYTGNGERVLIKEFLDSSHLLKSNHTYHIKIVIKNNMSSFYVDEKLFFQYTDPAPLIRGYFGFRTTHARHAIDNFVVYRLQEYAK